MNDYLNHAFVLFCALWVDCILRTGYTVLSIVILCIFLWNRKRKKCIWVFLIIVFLSRTDYYINGIPPVTSGRIDKVSQSSYVVKNGRYQFLLYTNQELLYDSIVSFKGEYDEISESYHFFSTNFNEMYNRKGIYYSVSDYDVTVEKEGSTTRAELQKKINQVEDEKLRILLRKIILGISYHSSEVSSSFLLEYGFALTGILQFLNEIMKYFFDQRVCKKISLLLCFIMMLVYHFPNVLMQYFLFHILRTFNIRKDEAIGISGILILLLYPGIYTSPSFLIPTGYRILNHFCRKKTNIQFFMYHIQSYFFNAINPLMALGYSLIRPYLGMCWVISILYLFSHHPFFQYMLEVISNILSVLNHFVINGSIAGIGFPFYLAMIVSLRKAKHKDIKRLLVFFLFMISGLFHPFTEVTFINVGQGDSILIRGYLNTANILIDTGKPNQYRNVKTMLDAKGIDSLSALIITHADSDHSGNQDQIIEDYHPEYVITEHHDELDLKQFQFLDLNTLNNEDENQSSIVELVSINGLDYLFMGDSDSVTEKEIILKYNQLSCDVLKLSHHGSKTGSSENFLDTVKPRLGIISSGAYSIYHHPSPETIQNLLTRHIPYLDTKEEGDITIVCIG